MPVIQPKTKKNPKHIKSVAVVTLACNRPVLLAKTLNSLTKAGAYMRYLFHDGEPNDETLALIHDRMIIDHPIIMPQQGHRKAWLEVIGRIQDMDDPLVDSYLLIEDDVVITPDAIEAAVSAYNAMQDANPAVGMLSLFRGHHKPQSEISVYDGKGVYRTVYHSFQCNLISKEALNAIPTQVIAAKMHKSIHGVDTFITSWLAEKGYSNFVLEKSLAAHIGMGNSIVQEQGGIAFHGMGFNMDRYLLRQVIQIYSELNS